MTGYAVQTADTDAGTVTVEFRSVNSRFLDLQFRINDELRAAEPALREAIVQRVARGKLECRVSFGRKAAGGAAPAANTGVLDTLAALQRSVRDRFPDAPPLTVHDVLRWPGVLAEAEPDGGSLQTEILATAAAALDAFVDSRQREGTALKAVLVSRIEAMEAVVQRLAPLVPQAIAQYQDKAMQRMREALGLALDGAERPAALSAEDAMERIRQEVTLYGMRIDVAEELARLSAHLAETRHILDKGGQVGKRLDFMMQELNREANTLGSKAAVKDLADASMELKLLIDQMREQVQNLE